MLRLFRQHKSTENVVASETQPGSSETLYVTATLMLPRSQPTAGISQTASTVTEQPSEMLTEMPIKKRDFKIIVNYNPFSFFNSMQDQAFSIFPFP